MSFSGELPTQADRDLAYTKTVIDAIFAAHVDLEPKFAKLDEKIEGCDATVSINAIDEANLESEERQGLHLDDEADQLNLIMKMKRHIES